MPFRMTVQHPQAPSSQEIFVPVSSSLSRNVSASVSAGDMSPAAFPTPSRYTSPFTVIVTVVFVLLMNP